LDAGVGCFQFLTLTGLKKGPFGFVPVALWPEAAQRIYRRDVGCQGYVGQMSRER
jgi:hypothetical protein